MTKEDKNKTSIFEGVSSEFPIRYIELECSHLENQEKCLVEEIGLKSTEAHIISKAIRDLVDNKIKEAKKEWSQDAKDAFVNLMTAILIQEVYMIKEGD